jgi:hypothetical protein
LINIVPTATFHINISGTLYTNGGQVLSETQQTCNFFVKDNTLPDKKNVYCVNDPSVLQPGLDVEESRFNSIQYSIGTLTNTSAITQSYGTVNKGFSNFKDICQDSTTSYPICAFNDDTACINIARVKPKYQKLNFDYVDWNSLQKQLIPGAIISTTGQASYPPSSVVDYCSLPDFPAFPTDPSVQIKYASPFNQTPVVLNSGWNGITSSCKCVDPTTEIGAVDYVAAMFYSSTQCAGSFCQEKLCRQSNIFSGILGAPALRNEYWFSDCIGSGLTTRYDTCMLLDGEFRMATGDICPNPFNCESVPKTTNLALAFFPNALPFVSVPYSTVSLSLVNTILELPPPPSDYLCTPLIDKGQFSSRKAMAMANPSWLSEWTVKSFANSSASVTIVGKELHVHQFCTTPGSISVYWCDDNNSDDSSRTPKHCPCPSCTYDIVCSFNGLRGTQMRLASIVGNGDITKVKRMKEIDFISKAKVIVLPPVHYTYPPQPHSSTGFWKALVDAFGSVGRAIGAIVGIGIGVLGAIGLGIAHSFGLLGGLLPKCGEGLCCCGKIKELCECCGAILCCAGTAYACYEGNKICHCLKCCKDDKDTPTHSHHNTPKERQIQPIIIKTQTTPIIPHPQQMGTNLPQQYPGLSALSQATIPQVSSRSASHTNDPISIQQIDSSNNTSAKPEASSEMNSVHQMN